MSDLAIAIAGLGMTELGKVYGRSAADFAAEACRLAVADAGLGLDQVDGLLVSGGVTGGVDLDLQRRLDLRHLGLLSEMNAYGSTACAMVQVAAMAIRAGTVRNVLCVFADAPLQPKGGGAGSAFGTSFYGTSGWKGLLGAAGVLGANPKYALAARRHMETYGTTTEQFAQIAVAQRAWAGLNPLALFREPITTEDHQASRPIVDPFRLLDCCMVSNGGVAVLVTSMEAAADLDRPPVEILGWGQSHPGRYLRRNDDFGLVTGAARSGAAAFAMAGLTIADVDVTELYDCYTYTVLVSLEDYGFCAKGEGGAFVADNDLGPGGSYAVNTGGGQLSSYYMWGMTPLSEAIIQARGDAGARQADRHEVVLVSGNGGTLDHHSTLILGGQR